MPPAKILLIVGIIEGRRFPRRPGHMLLVEAKFDGEVLSTDPIEHGENPEFTTELAWESDRKSLHQHRLQRTPVKIQCFAIDMIDNRKEPIGYCILDLRSVRMQEANLQKPQWYTLLNSKYQKMKPEIKVVLSLEDESQKMTSQPNKSEQITDVVDSVTQSKEPEVVLDDSEGYYVIGPKSEATKIYCLSVTIGTGKNLTKFVPSTMSLSKGTGFYFYYTLLGNKVSSEPFYDVIDPKFPAERASVRIFTNQKNLREFIELNSSLQFHFCYGEHGLATTSVSLRALLSEDSTISLPAKVEGLFPLTSSASSPRSPQGTEFNQPVLGISILLRDEINDEASKIPAASSPVLAAGGEVLLPEHPFSPATKQSKESYERDKHRKKADSSDTGMKQIRCHGNDESFQGNDNCDKHSLEKNTTKEEINKRDIEKQEFENGKMNVHEHQMKSRHYCYSIDLRSLKNLDTVNPIKCYCRYSYPFFGSSSPILTSPAIEVRRNTEVLLPRSFCAFEFATTSTLLVQTLSRIPLIVEVWHRDPNRKDTLFGVCQINLSNVFAAEKTMVEGQNYRQIYNQTATLLSLDSSRKKVGSLNFVLGLQDFGEIEEQQKPLQANQSFSDVSKFESSISESTDGKIQPGIIRQKRKDNNDDYEQQQQNHPNDFPRDNPEYKMAMELEIWKEQQEEEFKLMLKQKESKLMQTLADEWKRRDKEREMILKRKVDEYDKLEEKLRMSITDLERREKQISTSETEVQRLRADLLREHEQKLLYLRDASIRMKEDCEHRVELEKMKLKEVMEQNQRYREQLQLSENRYKDKENEIVLIKEQHGNQPENKLQAELNLALLEKAELERKLDAILKSKIHYKQQWGKALRELAKIKQNEQTAAKMRLKKQERELEHMRLRYLAAEEKEITKSEKEEIENMKAELRKLQEKQQASQPSPQEKQETEKNKEMAEHDVINSDDFQSRIAKLIEERDTLLHTGVYTTEDRIISELDRQIRDAIALKDR